MKEEQRKRDDSTITAIKRDSSDSAKEEKMEEISGSGSPETATVEDDGVGRECPSRSSGGAESPEQTRSAPDAVPSNPSSPRSPAPSATSSEAATKPPPPPSFPHLFPFGEK